MCTYNTAQPLGIAFGVAGLGSYFRARVAERPDAIEGVDADAVAQVMVGGGLSTVAEGIPASARSEVPAAAPEAFFAGLDEVFLMLAVIAIAGAAMAVALIRTRDFVIPAGGRAGEPATSKELAAIP